SVYAMVCPRGPTTRSGTGKTRRRRTVAPLPCARAATSGTIVSLRARALIGAKIRFAIESLLSFCDAAAGSVDSHGRGTGILSTQPRIIRKSARTGAAWPFAKPPRNTTVTSGEGRPQNRGRVLLDREVPREVGR